MVSFAESACTQRERQTRPNTFCFGVAEWTTKKTPNFNFKLRQVQKRKEFQEKQAVWKEREARHHLTGTERHIRDKGLCRNFTKHGGCKFGDACMFIHDDSSDATSTTMGDDDWSVPEVPLAQPSLSEPEEKEARKVERKLREITKIEARMAVGERVDVLQRQKVAKKDELLSCMVMVKIRAGYLRPAITQS